MLRWFIKYGPLYLVFRLFWWTKFINKRALRPYKGKPVVFVCNHKSAWDAVVMFMRIRRRIHFIAKDTLFKNGFIAWVLRSCLVYPASKGKELALMKYCMGALKRNEALYIFPEGTRIMTEEDALALRNGASMMAIKAGVDIVPMVIDRAPRAFRSSRIKVGQPISTAEYQDRKTTKDDLNDLSNKISSTMKEMLDGFERPEKKQSWELEPPCCSRAITFRENENRTEILLMRRSRPTYKNGATYYVLPGGHINEGESSRDAVIREIFEETGLDVLARYPVYRNWRSHGLYCNIGREIGNMESKMEVFWLCEYKSGEIYKDPNSEEYCCNASEAWGDGNPRGTFDPEWVDMGEVFKKDFDLMPPTLKKPLRRDFRKKKTRLRKRQMLLARN